MHSPPAGYTDCEADAEQDQEQRTVVPISAAAGNAGLMYYCTDCDSVYYDNGSTWTRVKVGDSVGPTLGDVPTTGWTAANMQSGCSWTSDADSMLLTLASNGSGHNWMQQYRTYPGAPFTLIIKVELIGPQPWGIPTGAGLAQAGLMISNGTAIISFGPYAYNGTAASPFPETNRQGVQHLVWTNATTYSGTYNTYAAPVRWIGGMPTWYKFIDNGTNRTFQYSLNGLEWSSQYTESRTAGFTPTRIGIGGSSYGGGTSYLRLRSWSGVA